MLKAGGNTFGSGKGRNGGKTGVSPFAADGGGSCGRRGNLRVSGEGLAFAEASFDLSEFATVRPRAASSKIAAFTELRWLRY